MFRSGTRCPSQAKDRMQCVDLTETFSRPNGALSPCAFPGLTSLETCFGLNATFESSELDTGRHPGIYLISMGAWAKISSQSSMSTTLPTTHVVSTLPSAYLNVREHASLAPPRGRLKTRSLATIRTFSRADLRQFSESVQHPMCPISDKKIRFRTGSFRQHVLSGLSK